MKEMIHFFWKLSVLDLTISTGSYSNSCLRFVIKSFSNFFNFLTESFNGEMFLIFEFWL